MVALEQLRAQMFATASILQLLLNLSSLTRDRIQSHWLDRVVLSRYALSLETLCSVYSFCLCAR